MRRRTIQVSDISVDTPDYGKAVEWLSANGIDPLEVPMDSELVVDAESITYERFPRSENGAYKLLPGEDLLVREATTVPNRQSPETFGL